LPVAFSSSRQESSVSLTPVSGILSPSGSGRVLPNCSHACLAIYSVGGDQLNLEQTQEAFWGLLATLPPDKQCTLLSGIFDMFLKKSTDLLHVLDGFIQLAINGMSHLKKCEISNAIFLLDKALGTMRQDQSYSLLSAKQMPMGLIEHCVNYFSATSINKVYPLI